jgi:hypothetical protein
MALDTAPAPIEVHVALAPATGRSMCAAFGWSGLWTCRQDATAMDPTHRRPRSALATAVSDLVLRAVLGSGSSPLCLVVACARHGFSLRVVTMGAERDIDLTVVDMAALILGQQLAVAVAQEPGAGMDWDAALRTLLAEEGGDA